MRKIFKASTIKALLLVLFLFLATPLYPYDFDRYRQDDSFNLPSFRFQDFQQELNRQKGVFSPTFNAYENFNDNNISRNLFGFDVTDPVSVAANFEVQKDLASLPETAILIDVTNLAAKEFYLPQASKKPVEVEAQSAKGAELFAQQFGGLEIKTDNEAAIISSEKDIVPGWFKPGKSVFEPTQSEQVSGQDVEQVKNRLSRQDALISNVSVRSDLPIEGNEDKFIDAVPQLQNTADFIPQASSQNFEKELAQVIPITPLELVDSDSAVMPGESWNKIKAEILVETLTQKQDKQLNLKYRNSVDDAIQKVEPEAQDNLSEDEKQELGASVNLYFKTAASDDFVEETYGKKSAVDLNKLIGTVNEGKDLASAKKHISKILNLEGKRKDIWMDYGILVMPGNRNKVSENEYGFMYDTLSNIPENMRVNVRGIITVDKEPIKISTTNKRFLAGWTFKSSEEAGIIFVNDILAYSALEKEEYGETISHETGHVLENFKFITEQQLEKRDNLYKNSSQSAMTLDNAGKVVARDFARIYPKVKGLLMPNEREDLATMFEAYYNDCIQILERALSQAKDGNPILLQKFELISSLFNHNNEDGKLSTCIFTKDTNGNISRRESLLIVQTINNRVYKLPEIAKDILMEQDRIKEDVAKGKESLYRGLSELNKY